MFHAAVVAQQERVRVAEKAEAAGAWLIACGKWTWRGSSKKWRSTMLGLLAARVLALASAATW